MVGTQKEYNQQCNYYITVILQSGLLLDEDLQALSAQYTYNYDELSERKKTQIWPVASTGIAALCSLYWLKKSSVLMAMVCTTPAVGLALICTVKAFNKKKQMRYIDVIVEYLKDVVILNKLIIKYLRERIITSKSYGDSIFVAYTSRIEEMVRFIVDAEIYILKQLKEALVIFSGIVGEIKESYLYLNQIDLNLFKLHSAGSAEECITFLQKFSGMFILHVSHYLSCLGLTLCPSLWLPSSRLPSVFDATFALRNGISLIVPTMKARFNAVKFDLHRKLCNPVLKNIDKTGGCKLKSNVVANLIHAAFILEQANGILNRLDDGDDASALLKNLESLRDSTSDYCEKLNVLCRMCSNEIAPRKETIRQIQTQEVDDRNDNVVAPDNDEEVAEPTSDDDVYELDMQRIPHNDGLNQNSFIDVDDSASVQFASLMVQELKHSLKTDQRFLAAREKRGIVDQLPVKKHKEKTVINPEPPEEVNVVKTLSGPAPPPPPLPSSSFTTVEDFDDDEGTESDFLKAIRGEYAKRNTVVDVIEDRDD